MKLICLTGQVNHTYGRGSFLPYSSGLLIAYACKDQNIRDNFEFLPPLFKRDPINEVVQKAGRVDVAALSCYIWNWSYTIALAKAIKEANPHCLVVLGGPHVPTRSEGFFREHPYADLLVHYEGEQTFREVLLRLLDNRRWYLTGQPPLTLWESVQGLSIHSPDGTSLKTPDRPRINDLDDIPSPYLKGVFDSHLKMNYDWHPTWEGTRGCPFACLAGDTLINTVYGLLPIRELATDYTEVGVFTYDRDEAKAKVSTAINIQRTGQNKKLVRVTFDDGSYIDCTPDHKFLTFGWGNQFVPGWEEIVEAQNLKLGVSVRAIKEGLSGAVGNQYLEVAWSRKGRNKKHRLILEWLIGRNLMEGEEVHHKDHDRLNNHPDNLELTSSRQDHMDRHPEIAERMRIDNPTKGGLSQEWKDKIGKSLCGKKRSEESRERYRKAAIRREAIKREARLNQDKSTPGDSTGNHKVAYVESLPGLHDVYCMEVPDTGWFYANNVLVKNCTFCDWGSLTLSKVKKHSDAYLMEEIEWHGKNKLSLLYGADANTGAFERDVKLAEFMVKTKEKYGYPEKFRAAYAKNSVDRVFEINRILNKANMSKGATLSFQSMDEGVLEAIKRRNIGTEKYKALMQKYRAENIPTYSEIIIGLAGETYDSFADGLDSLLNAGCHSGLSVYTCELLPNSEMSFPEYRDKYGLKSVTSPVPFYHGTPSDDPHQEFYEIVTATSTLSEEDWLKCQMLAWAVQGFHCLGATQALAVIARYRDGISYRKFYEGLLRHGYRHPETTFGKLCLEMLDYFKDMQAGKPLRNLIDPQFGNICWPPEEYAYLRVVTEPTLGDLVNWICEDEDLQYQLCLTLSSLDGCCIYSFSSNIHEFVEGRMLGDDTTWLKEETRYEFTAVKKYDSLESFAREIVWFGRKGGAKRVEVKQVTKG